MVLGRKNSSIHRQHKPFSPAALLQGTQPVQQCFTDVPSTQEEGVGIKYSQAKYVA